MSLLTLVAGAHEFWIHPASYRPQTGKPTNVDLLVGAGFPGEAKKRDPSRFERFEVAGPDAKSGFVAIGGTDGLAPAGLFTFDKPGLHQLVYRGKPSRISLEGEAFDEYLAEEGLTDVLAQRSDSKETGTPAVESYSRCAKSFVAADNNAEGDFSRLANLTLEIVPLTNPCRVASGDQFRVRVLHEGTPQPDAQVKLMVQVDGKTVAVRSRTSADGEVVFTIQHAGVHVLNVVRMTRSKIEGVNWESVWSTLSFEVLPKPAATPAP